MVVPFVPSLLGVSEYLYNSRRGSQYILSSSACLLSILPLLSVTCQSHPGLSDNSSQIIYLPGDRTTYSCFAYSLPPVFCYDFIPPLITSPSYATTRPTAMCLLKHKGARIEWKMCEWEMCELDMCE